jgi:hypothetical protein
VRRAPDRLAWWPCDAVREILSEAKGRDPRWSACVERVDHRYFERDEFRTRSRQQVKELDGAPGVLRPRIGCRYLDVGSQVESAKFAGGIPPGAALL